MLIDLYKEKLLKLHFALILEPEGFFGSSKQLPYELNKMAFSPTDLKSDEHRAEHPLGRVQFWRMETPKYGNLER